MEKELESVVFEILPYKDSGTYIIKAFESASHLVDDSLTTLQSKASSKKPCGEELVNWENKLRTTQNVLDEWLQCQTSWLYLYPIFNSKDIQEQCPVENKRFQVMDGIWRNIMKTARDNPRVISLCPDKQLLNSLRECNKLSEEVQKGLNNYLATKRNSFPRFYFLSNDDVLEILSQQKDFAAVQKHIKKCFDNIAGLKIGEDLKITKMISGEGEEVDFTEALYPTGNVEDWLLEMERVMKRSLRKMIKESLMDYKQVPRTEWVLKWPAQVAIAGCQTYWTQEVTKALEQNNLKEHAEVVYKQMVDLRGLLRKEISRNARRTLTTLIILEVRARDAVTRMAEENVNKLEDFQWVSQLRYYWSDENLFVRALNAEFAYGYEYLGNPLRLVITPLTDRCFLTLISAFHLKLGGSPHGPAGTGKTESTKDLAKIMGMQCVVFNCSDQLDYLAMGKFFQGIASTGAWACFDEFNRIDIEVLSVVGQQIAVLQKAQREKAEQFFLEGVEVTMKPSFAIIITMNPGYAGRTELPDNVKTHFRPAAMMIPDYALITEVMLYAFGFSNAGVLSKKIVSLFKLSSEQLSRQDHYDFGMRAVKTVVFVCGNLKRQYPDMDEEMSIARALRDVNATKFVEGDLKLFNGLISDLFPNVKEEPKNYKALDTALKKACSELDIEAVPGFIQKCTDLFEVTLVRHGIILIGPPASGKTKCYEALQKAQTALNGEMSSAGVPFVTTHSHVLNPKSITMNQLYGYCDPLTHEWNDGLVSKLLRVGSQATNKDKQWYMFDGPVDACWVENMNSVLDDNKKLDLHTGEIINLTDHMTILFEVQDLCCASPATVSRCGMVYFEPSNIGIDAFVESWLKKLPDCISIHKEKLQSLFSAFMEPAIKLLRSQVEEIVTTIDANLVFSLLKLMDCFISPFMPKEGAQSLPKQKLDRITELLEPWFIFSLVWSIGATGDNDGRKKFSDWLRQKMKQEKVQLMFPGAGSVYDYKLDDAGIEKEVKDKIYWKEWMSDVPEVIIAPKTRFCDIVVPTVDTISSSHVMEMLLTNNKTVLCVGPIGTGKSLTITEKLSRGMPENYLSEFIAFSARTSANGTQDIIDGKLAERNNGAFGPPAGKQMIFFIDDLNMPMLEVYGAQPARELIRQWMDYGGWYDQKNVGTFKKLVDVNFICAMGPPGGGRSRVTPRLMRHFNILGFTEAEDQSKRRIFGTILKSWTSQSPKLDSYSDMVISTCIDVYNSVQTQLLPTPAKCHYTFNLRDLSKVFQGIMMADPIKTNSIESLLKLWFHENCRVFQDRLVNDEDKSWFGNLLKDKMSKVFNKKYEEVVTSEFLIFGDFMVPNVNDRLYIEITDHDKMVKSLNGFLDEYNKNNKVQMNLVLFMDAVKHVSRISRIIRQPFGNALLLGMGGSGRQSLTRLASYMSGFDCLPLLVTKNYGFTEWRENLRRIMLKAGLENKSLVFLFSDTQIKSEIFCEDINNILNYGDVPSIYGLDDLDRIYTAMKPIVKEAGLQPTKTNLFSAFKKQVKNNLHTVITMSPYSENFRVRLRQYPAFVNCCTIDWFSEWPEDALQSVASRYLNETPELDNKETVLKGLVVMCQEIHQSVAKNSVKFREELRRYNYVTPTSYLDFLSILSNLIAKKKSEVVRARTILENGVDKVSTAAEEVSRLNDGTKMAHPLIESSYQTLVKTLELLSPKSPKYEEQHKQMEEMKAQLDKLEQNINRGEKLKDGLTDIKNRWKESAPNHNKFIDNTIGDVLISAAFVAYLGPFTSEYRSRMLADWVKSLDAKKVSRTSEHTLIDTMGDQVKIKSWQANGLPKDSLSVENGVIIQFSKRWPLLIDSQGQASKWVQNMERNNGLVVASVSDADFLETLEKAIPFGRPCLLQNVGDQLNPVLDSILLKETFKQQDNLMIKIGDTVIPYNENFKLYMTTNLPNPHFAPDVSAKVSVVNFTLTPSVLEDRLLGIVVAEKTPDLDKSTDELIVSQAKLKKEVTKMEDFILHRLTTAQGSLLDDVDIITNVEACREKSADIKAKESMIEKKKKEINEITDKYRTVAKNSQLLYFCVADMARIDTMYQYSLEWFINIFLEGIASSEGKVQDCTGNITFSVYRKVCRGLFEKHKLLFAFLLAARMKMHQGLINMDEWRHLLSGGTEKPKDVPNPASDWISQRSWNEFLVLASVKKFSGFVEDFKNHLAGFKAIFDSNEPHRKDLPGQWNKEFDAFQKILVTKCLRPDKLVDAMKDYISNNLGQRFIEPQKADIRSVYEDSSPTSPVIFVLSPGTDPTADLMEFAAEMDFSGKISAISLGQGLGVKAEAIIRNAIERGGWVYLQNCHLSPSWMPSLEKILKRIEPDEVHGDFRLWLSTMPSDRFPSFVIQNAVKMTIEPLRGVKSHLLKSYNNFSDDFYNACGKKTPAFKHLLLSLCMFHGVVLERRKYTMLGFNIPYEFVESDLKMCIDQLKLFLPEYEEVPFEMLSYTVSEVNYGGRVRDCWDRRCMRVLFDDFYNKDVLKEGYKYSESGIYHQINSASDHKGYMSYIQSLPSCDSPEIVGLHDNADITLAIHETNHMLNALLETEPNTGPVGGKSREEIIEDTAKRILQVPKPIPVDSVMKKYPVLYEQSLNTVLIQEVIRYNTLLKIIHQNLEDLLKALKGLVVMSHDLKNVADSLYKNIVPTMWQRKAYASLKPLASWVTDLVARMNFITEWIDHGIPAVFWISGFFFPQAFLTGTLQNFARKKSIPVDTLSFSFDILKENYKDLKNPPEDGCHIHGLYMEGARWNDSNFILSESKPKELYTNMPVILLKPTANRKSADSGFYNCPVYKTLIRKGTLSTTGHSTNFVFTIEVPSDKPQKHWIKRGVALFCTLDY